MTALSLQWPEASALVEQRGWNNFSLLNENEMQEPSTPSLQAKSWPTNWDEEMGGYKEKHISVSAYNFVRGNVTMAMGGLC